MTAAAPPPRRRPGQRRQAALLAAAVVVLCGCGVSQPRLDGARRAAAGFEESLARADYAGACAQLAPQSRRQLEEDAARPCGQALAGEELPDGGAVRATQVYGRQALLHLERDTLFLSQFAGGWKVVAAGCEPGRGAPPAVT
ncbi:hypothetical protein ACWGDD_11735 [Streptomyces sp. NPDC055011]